MITNGISTSATAVTWCKYPYSRRWPSHRACQYCWAPVPTFQIPKSAKFQLEVYENQEAPFLPRSCLQFVLATLLNSKLCGERPVSRLLNRQDKKQKEPVMGETKEQEGETFGNLTRFLPTLSEGLLKVESGGNMRSRRTGSGSHKPLKEHQFSQQLIRLCIVSFAGSTNIYSPLWQGKECSQTDLVLAFTELTVSWKKHN